MDIKQLDNGPPIVAPYGMTAHPGYAQLQTAAAHRALMYALQYGQRDYPWDTSLVSLFPETGMAGLTPEESTAAMAELVAAGLIRHDPQPCGMEGREDPNAYRLLFTGAVWPRIEQVLQTVAEGVWWQEYCREYAPEEEEEPVMGCIAGAPPPPEEEEPVKPKPRRAIVQ